MATESLTQKWLRQNVQPYPHKDRVFTDIDGVLDRFPTLRPKSDVYTYDDGRTQLLLCVHGLLPISYRKASYNIPIAVWLTREYPQQPPLAYVVPTNDMLVRAGKHIDVSGKCRLEYQEYWERKSEGCNLFGLLEAMQAQFSREPPVYSKSKVPPTTAVSRSTTPVTLAQASYSGRLPPALPGGEQASFSAPLPTSSASSSPNRPALPPKPGPLTPDHLSASFQSSSLGAISAPLSGSSVGVLLSQTPRAALADQSLPYAQPQQYRVPQPPSAPPRPPPPPPIPNTVAYLSSNTAPYQSYPATSFIPRPPSLPSTQPTQTPIPSPNLLEDESPALRTNTASVPPRSFNPELLNLHNQVHQKLKQGVASLSQAFALDAERLHAHQVDLLAGEPAIRDEMSRLEAVRDVCRNVAGRLQSAVEQAEQNVSDLRRKGVPEVDELVCSTSIVHNQLINLIAEDNAIEDTIYHLHRALNTGRIDLERFIRTTRVLAEEQFMKRALIEKIQEGIPMGVSMGSEWA